MSQMRHTSHNPVGLEEWDRVLTQLRAEGFSPIESIKVTRAVLDIDLGEAKRIVHMSAAWANAREEFERLHDIAASATADL